MRLSTTIGSSAIAALLAASPAAGEIVYGVTASQALLSWDSGAPTDIQTGTAIQGLGQNEKILGMDFRPLNGKLYALGSFSNLYTIDVTTGQASLVGNFSGSGTSLNGSSFGFDFNPTIDRIRVVSEADQNLVLNPDTGGATAVTDLFYGSGDAAFGVNPNNVASAYTNSFAGATTTQLYGVDTAQDTLLTQANSAGVLTTVGSLGVDVNDTLAFDISGASGVGYMSVQASDLTRSTFWTVDLGTGEAMMLGEIGGGALVTAIAVVPAPVAAAPLLAGVLGSRRRRN